MNFFALVLLGLSLAMDAFAISVSNGVAYQGNKKQIFITALSFGLAQAIMPLLGYALGTGISHIIERYDHWVAFGLLVIIGGKMLWESLRDLRRNEKLEPQQLTGKTLFIQSVATSIDALAVGISLAALNVYIIPASALIGIITFLCCVIGGSLGQSFGRHLQRYAGIVGGIILCLLGVKILLNHLGAL